MAPLNLSNLPAAKSSDGNANLAAKNRDIMTKSPDEGANDKRNRFRCSRIEFIDENGGRPGASSGTPNRSGCWMR
jgi:hypothetical protein